MAAQGQQRTDHRHLGRGLLVEEELPRRYRIGASQCGHRQSQGPHRGVEQTPEAEATQDLIDAVIQKTGLPADKAKAAVEAVLGQFKTKLPGPLANEIDKLAGGGTSAEAGGLGSIADKLGLQLRVAPVLTRGVGHNLMRGRRHGQG